jgi:hypothetical protein
MNLHTICMRTGRALILVGGLLSAQWTPAKAQDASTALEHLQIALWPEYDRPALLVIYRFQLASEVELPAQVELPIPAAVGEPHAVAWQDADAGLFDAAYTLIADEPWSLVQIEMEQSRLGQLEYYSEINIQGAQRSFEFNWPGTVDLAGFSYEVQQPIGAIELTIEPAATSQGPGLFGLNYLSAELGAIAQDSTIEVRVSYRKDSPLLSVDALQPLSEPATPVAAEPGPANLLPWLLAGGGVLLIAGGVLYYTRGRPRPTPRPRKSRVSEGAAGIEASAIFCHHCGTKAQVNDVFCRNCGTRLRKK